MKRSLLLLSLLFSLSLSAQDEKTAATPEPEAKPEVAEKPAPAESREEGKAKGKGKGKGKGDAKGEAKAKGKGNPEARERRAKRMAMAEELEKQGDLSGAAQILEEFSKRQPNNAELHQRLGLLWLKERKFAEAIPHVERYLEISEAEGAEYAAFGQLLLEAEQTEVALGFLEKAAVRFPDLPELPYLLTFPLSRMERWSEAVAQFNKALELSTGDKAEFVDENFHFRHAAALDQAGKREEAVAMLRGCIERITASRGEFPREFEAMVNNHLAYLWIEKGENLEEAGVLAKKAAALDPESGAIADTVGWYYFQTGDYPRALADLKRAERQIENPDPVVFDHIGQTLVKLNEKEIAAEYFQRALELDPDNAELKKRLEETKP